MGLKMGVLAGDEIFGHKSTQRARDNAIAQLKEGELDGLIMTDRVGACGHNLTGANVMIFLGSLYSQPYEDQAAGNISLWMVTDNRPDLS
jgi:superfamily II DNA or RNA helicase